MRALFANCFSNTNGMDKSVCKDWDGALIEVVYIFMDEIIEEVGENLLSIRICLSNEEHDGKFDSGSLQMTWCFADLEKEKKQDKLRQTYCEIK